MTGFALQGIACEFGKCFAQGGEIIYLKPGVFDHFETDVKLLIDHAGKSFATTADRLDIYLGSDALTFRFTMPDSWTTKEFSEVADDLDTYLPVSVGFKYHAYETVMIDGAKVKIIGKATLNEISVISEEPAIKSTFARIVSLDSCNSLEEDHERIKLIGRYISLHRKMLAEENGGKVNYSHSTSDYERKASAFERALRNLA